MPEFALEVNGRRHQVTGEAGDSVLAVLRDDLALSGTKFGCGEGQCGACTVLVDGQTTRSCVLRLGALTGRAITTIEGIGEPGRLHPVQQAFVDAEAFQCGYCTPGMVMATIGLLRERPDPTDADIAQLLERNVCRCGTYPRIAKAIRDAATRIRTGTSGSGR